MVAVIRKDSSFVPSSKLLLLGIGFLVGVTISGFLRGSTSTSLLEFAMTTTTSAVDATQQREDCDGTTTTSSSKESPLQPPPRTHPQWCPIANCTNTDLCHPCQRRFLIVLATARSASTTLTWMLHELPGIRMAGENNNHLNQLYEMKHNLWNHSSFVAGQGRKNAWGHHDIPPQTFACAAQSTVEAINPPLLVERTRLVHPEEEPQDIIGFKTIRFDRGSAGLNSDREEDHYDIMVDFVKEHFPCSRILININSNVTRQAQSFKAANFFHISPKSLQRRNAHLMRVQQLFGNHQAYLLDAAQWTTNVTVLNQAVEWLGFHKSCQFQELLEFNTAGGHGFQNAKEKLSSNHRDVNCQRLVG